VFLANRGKQPILDRILRKNPILMWLNSHGYWLTKPSAFLLFAIDSQQRRREILKTSSQVEDEGEEPLTDKFLRAQEKDPEVIGPLEVLSLGIALVIAGSGTTSITLSAILYYTLKNPTVYRKLQAEIDSHYRAGGLDPFSLTPLSFIAAQALPYLSAVIKEAFRMHPATVGAAERVVPPQGHNICGEHVPGGTVVSVSPWVLHQNKDIFGYDSDVFRPERWLEKDIESTKRMERTMLHFGAGQYTCIGKNIALMEIYKVLPALLAHFEITLAYPEKEWKILPGFFVHMTDFEVRLATRTRS
jgi:cytochrome P450